jgi:hypothetical protein
MFRCRQRSGRDLPSLLNVISSTVVCTVCMSASCCSALAVSPAISLHEFHIVLAFELHNAMHYALACSLPTRPAHSSISLACLFVTAHLASCPVVLHSKCQSMIRLNLHISPTSDLSHLAVGHSASHGRN